MCGIAGFSLKPNSGIDPGVLAASLALGIESRGRDATGCAWFSPSHKSVRYLKEPVPASEYIEDLVNGVDEDAGQDDRMVVDVVVLRSLGRSPGVDDRRHGVLVDPVDEVFDVLPRA